MRRWLWLVLVACGSSTQSAPAPSNVTAAAPPVTAAHALVPRDFVEQESGTKLQLWIDPSRVTHVDTNDPCCGLSYDGNRYDDALATCATKDDECGPGKTAVYPGLADDGVCGERRRCVPDPRVRVVVHDATPVAGVDMDDRELAIGNDPALEHRAVNIGREGFIVVTIAGRDERVALDYGSRYTIDVERGAIARITRD